MLEISNDLTAFLATQTVFTAVIADRLRPIVADETIVFPFSTYRINEQLGQSKDGTTATIAIYFWFKTNEYKKCVAFTDAMKPIIEQNYDWQNSTVDFIEENQSYVGIINFNTY
jgi:hypothetical protein